MPANMFTYSRLPDPTKQFRLLSFEPSSPKSTVSCRLETHFITDNPPYYAISYHYGDPSAVSTVLVNGQETQVNRNCWHALNQIRTQSYTSGLFWVDSLCINQSDLKEKSLQVHRIAAIFSGADEVWACFGPASGDSDFLLQKLAMFPPESPTFSINTAFAERSDDLQRRTVNWMVSLGNEFGRFAAALKAFGSRPFFSRMWIYQEIFLASNMKMLFGREAADMQALKDVTQVCSTLMMSYCPQSEYDYKDAQLDLNKLLWKNDLFVKVGSDSDLGALRLLVGQLQSKHRLGKVIHFGDVSGIVQVQEAIQRLNCQDPRDKIFAIISLFGSSSTITPDYKISCFDLALRVLNEYATCVNDRKCVELAAYLCHNLRLDSATVNYDIAVARNQILLQSNRDNGLLVSPRSMSTRTNLQQTTPWACQVLRNEVGQMTAPFISPGPPSSPTSTNSKTIVVNQQPVAIATCFFETGDWIAPLGHYISDCYHSYCIGLVFRLRAGNVYDIVGEVAFFPSCRPCVSWEDCRCQFGEQFHTNYATSFAVAFDCEELLLFSIGIREPYDTMRKESPSAGRGEPRLPTGLPLNWRSSCAVRSDSTKPLVTRIP
jgi:hypothetical protein